MQAWKRLDDGSNVTKVGFRSIVHKQFRMNDGGIINADITSTEGTQTAGVIAITEDNRIVVAKQFRCGPEKIMNEMPGGLVDPGETPEQATRRELLEEVGYEAGELGYLGSVHLDPWGNTLHHYFLARNCRPIAEQKLEKYEEVDIELLSITDFLESAKSGNMTDTHGVLLAYDTLKEMEET